MSKKTVVILSGGLDSTTLLWHLKAAGNEVKALSINYGQRHKKELLQAAKIALLAEVEHRVVDFSSLQPLLGGSSQTDYSVDVPEGHYAEESMKKTIVSQRNLLMLSAAAAWATSLRFDSIAYGAHAGDHAIYPDCREEFVQALEKTIKLGDWHQVSVDRPFVNMTKADIVRLATKIGSPSQLSWTCYKGGDLHCGRCGTCVERLGAFDDAGMVDPVEYADREYYKKVLAGAK